MFRYAVILVFNAFFIYLLWVVFQGNPIRDLERQIGAGDTSVYPQLITQFEGKIYLDNGSRLVPTPHLGICADVDVVTYECHDADVTLKSPPVIVYDQQIWKLRNLLSLDNPKVHMKPISHPGKWFEIYMEPDGTLDLKPEKDGTYMLVAFAKESGSSYYKRFQWSIRY